MKYGVLIVAILVIGVMECFALHKGIDGVLLSLAFTGIGGLAAYAFRLPRRRGKRGGVAKKRL